MIKNKKPIVFYKLFFGLLGGSAVVTEIIVLVQRGSFVPANFFSFFTIQSNLLASVVLLVGALLFLQNRRSSAYDMYRGAITLYMVITGSIFALLLSGLDAGVLTAVPWDNTALHYIMPIAVFGDWLLDAPKQRIFFRQALFWLFYPIAYLVYTLVRGHYVGWYPYPFLNVAEKGYVAVLMVSVGVALLVTGLGWVISRLTKRTQRVQNKA